MSARTPGPWTIAYDGNPNQNPYWHAVELHAGPLLVARVECTNASGQGPHNARLMEAAPRLLAVLEFIVNDAEPGEDARLTVEGYNRACAAISKATGKPSVRASTPEECAKDERAEEIEWWREQGWTWEYPGFLQAPGTPGYNFTVGLDEPDVRFLVQITNKAGAHLGDLWTDADKGEYQEREQVLVCLEAFKKARGL